ncbi:hypothetical protein EYF80_020283 [Liparis tanakae]|uniref:Uncharacterized protein n=1 Tax=Liparis tanakae TaxID=230148 RepID=A0A4Z2HUF0_9TELE|nr:hypothetical protein EYF80_020283 [Liparis tanakae]
MSTSTEVVSVCVEPCGTTSGTPFTVRLAMGCSRSTVTLKCSVRVLTWLMAVTWETMRRTTADKPASVTLLRASSSTCTGLLRSSAVKLRASTAYKLGSGTSAAPDSELAAGRHTPGLEENSSGQSCWKVTLWLLPRREALVRKRERTRSSSRVSLGCR